MGNATKASPHKAYKKYDKSECRYMMATKAFAGDKCDGEEISREEPDLCRISAEHDACYIGNWVTGYGFLEVHFPKETTRELTQEDVNSLHGTLFGGCGPTFGLFKNTKGQLQPFAVTRQPEGAFQILDSQGNLLNPTSRKGKRLYFPFAEIADRYARFACEGLLEDGNGRIVQIPTVSFHVEER